MSLTVSRPRRTVEFCTNLALKAEHEDALRVLGAAQRAQKQDPREASTAVREAAERVQAVEQEMRSHTVVFTLEAWPRKRWAEFEETHPPREDRDEDANLSINVASLDQVIASTDPRTIVSVKSLDGADVEFDPSEWQRLADEMTNGQWEDFAIAVLQANRGVKAVPFSGAASHVIQNSAPSSN